MISSWVWATMVKARKNQPMNFKMDTHRVSIINSLQFLF